MVMPAVAPGERQRLIEEGSGEARHFFVSALVTGTERKLSRSEGHFFPRRLTRDAEWGVMRAERESRYGDVAISSFRPRAAFTADARRPNSTGCPATLLRNARPPELCPHRAILRRRLDRSQALRPRPAQDPRRRRLRP